MTADPRRNTALWAWIRRLADQGDDVWGVFHRIEEPSVEERIDVLAHVSRMHAVRGDFDAADRYLQAGHRQAIAEFGDTSPAARRYLADRASFAAMRGDNAAAVELRTEALDAYRAALGDGDPSTLEAVDRLATALFAAGRRGDAIQLYLDPRSQAGTPRRDQPAVAEATKWRLYTTDESTTEAVAEQALLRALNGTRSAILDRATHLLQVGRTGEYVAIFDDLYDEAAAVHGADHPDAISARIDLGVAVVTAGDVEGGAVILSGAVGALERNGGQPLLLARARIRFARATRDLGLFDAAEAQARAAATTESEVLGPWHPSAASGIVLANWLEKAGRPADALPLWQERHTALVDLLGPDAHESLFAEFDVVQCLHLTADPGFREAADDLLRRGQQALPEGHALLEDLTAMMDADGTI